ncbi:MAG: hypothetical protein HC813_04115 [Planctomycetes bacterium]|nr:hypothetical protein [Planctomycetota bacterium]
MGQGMNFVALVFALMIPCYIVYRVLMPVEMKAGKRRGYRVLRHYWRIVVGTYVVHAFGTLWHRGEEGPALMGHALDAAMTVIGFFLLYLNSRRLDAKQDIEPIRSAWIDLALDPVLRRVAPPISREVPVIEGMRVRTGAGESLEIRLGVDQILHLGSRSLPLAMAEVGEMERSHRGKLAAAALLLFLTGPVLVKKVFGNLRDLLPQLFGLAGILASLALLGWALLKHTPSGLLGGPFRSHWIHWRTADGQREAMQIRFRESSDERLLLAALVNSRMARPAIAS